MHFRRFICFNKQLPMIRFFLFCASSAAAASAYRWKRNRIWFELQSKVFQFLCQCSAGETNAFFPFSRFLCRLCVNATHFCKAKKSCFGWQQEQKRVNEWEKNENDNKLIAPSVARSIHLIKSLYICIYFVYFVGQSARACHCYRKIIIVCMAEKCVYKIWWLCRFWFSVSTVEKTRQWWEGWRWRERERQKWGSRARLHSGYITIRRPEMEKRGLFLRDACLNIRFHHQYSHAWTHAIKPSSRHPK